MKEVTFTQAATVYPDGTSPVRYEIGAKAKFEDAYADLLVKKGHCVEADAAPHAPANEEHHA